jgi:hypothetical protein
MEPIVKAFGVVLLATGLIFGLSVLMAYPTMWLVNYLITPSALLSLFGIAQLTFWKAFWLNFLCGFLFKSTSVSTKSK